MDQMVFFWEDIKARTEEREMKFLDVLELAEKFWYDMAALLTTIKDTQDIVHDLESPGIDPSIIKQQVEAAEVRPMGLLLSLELYLLNWENLGPEVGNQLCRQSGRL